jgi:formylglycine-generating enzyme required for sulfatase activity
MTALFVLRAHAQDDGAPPPFAIPAGVQHVDGKFLSIKDGMELVHVPAGAFLMGSANGHYSERPAHQVYLDAYLIDIHEVTNAQFEKFVSESGYQPHGPWKRGFQDGQEEHPVRFVTWHDAKAYADWAGRELPTEAMWEKAARGPAGHVYPWGPTWKQRAAHTDLAVDAGPGPVGAYPNGASPYGCLDMGGNVWEWVNDWYDRYYYERFRGEMLARNPQGPKDDAPPETRFVRTNTAAGNERSTRKVIRGGGWVSSGQENLRCSKRYWGNPKYWFNDTGFRCAISLTGVASDQVAGGD